MTQMRKGEPCPIPKTTRAAVGKLAFRHWQLRAQAAYAAAPRQGRARTEALTSEITISKLASIGLFLFLSNGCYTVQHRYEGSTIITNAREIEGKTTKVKHFEKHDRQWWLLFGFIELDEPINGPKLAAEEAGPGQAIVNFRLKDGLSTFDALLFGGLSGLFGSGSVWVEGDVIE